MFKNVASQKLTLFVFDSATGLPKTGDATNLTAYVSKDDGTVTALGDTSATEVDSTNAKGEYVWDLTQAETNADKLQFTGKSSTTGIVVVREKIYTVPASWSVTVGTNNDKTGYTVSTVSDKTGYALTAAYDLAKTAAQTGDIMKVSSGTGANQISLSSGLVTVGTNNDKTGYSLAAADYNKLLGYKTVTYIATTDTAKTVIEAAAAGTLCVLAPGTHALGTNQLTIPDGVSVRGCGRDVTTMTTTYTSATNQILKPGSNSELSDFTFQTTNSTPGTTFDYVIGATSGSFTNSVVRRMRFIGHTDCIYITSSTACSLSLDDVVFESDWDTCVTGGGDHTIQAVNVVFAPTENNSFHQMSGMNIGTGKIIGRNVRVRCRLGGSTGQVTGIGVASGARAYLENSSVFLDGVASSFTASISAFSPSRFVNCEYDRSKASGTFVDAFTPLQPTTWLRKLDVSAGGEAGLDWANIGSPTTSNTLSATTISSSQIAASVTAGVTVSTNNDKTGYTVSTVSDKTGYTVSTVSDKTGYSLSAAGAGAIWDATTASHLGTGTTGAALNSANLNASDAADRIGEATTFAESAAANSETANSQLGDVLNSLNALPGQIASQNDIAHALDTINTNLDVAASTRLAASSYTTPPSAATVASAVAAQSTIATMASTVATNLDSKVSEAGGSGGGTIIPVSQVPVPLSRTWNLKSRGAGLIGEVPLFATVGESQTWAMSFAADLPANGRVVSFDTISVTSGQTGGIDFSDDDNDFGVDRGEAKFKFTCSEGGTYQITVGVSYDEGTGGGSAIGVGTLIVRAA